MHNASQSGSGFRQQQSGAPILKRAREAAPQIAAGGLATFAILCVLTVAWVKIFDYQTAELQSDIDAKQAQTETGAFAVDQLLQCKHKSTFHSFSNTNADCIDRVVEAAQNLKGDQVAGEVTRHLGIWLERSTKLQGLRLEDRQIASYIAKYGFALAGFRRNMVIASGFR